MTKKENKLKITFDKSASTWVLEIFGMYLDGEDYIIKDGERVLDIFYNEEIHIKDFGGITKEGLIKGDVFSIMRLVDKQKIGLNDQETG